MNIELIKFFQAVQVKTPTTYSTVQSVTSKDFEIEFDGHLIKIGCPGTGEKTITSMQNVQYMRVKDVRPEATKGSRGAGKTPEAKD